MPLRARTNIWGLTDPPLGTVLSEGADSVTLAFSAVHVRTGLTRRCFIEYGVVNPGRDAPSPVVDRIRADGSAAAPCHAFVRAGAWDAEPIETIAHYPVSAITHDRKQAVTRLGPCHMAADAVSGRIDGSAGAPPTICWTLAITPRLPPAPEHLVTGLPIALSGSFDIGGDHYLVDPATAAAHADRRTARARAVPWFRIASADLAAEQHPDADFLGIAAEPRRGSVTARLRLGARCHDFIPGGVFSRTMVSFAAPDLGESIGWKLVGKSPIALLEVSVSCNKIEMLRTKPQQPDGRYQHGPLWRGGTGRGEARLYARHGQALELIDTIAIRNALCEFGDRASLY